MENLISTLIKQHRSLQQDVTNVLDLCNSADTTNFTKIDQGIKKFTKNLVEHLELENDTFYVGLLEKMKQAGQDTAKTEQFIAEMKDIEKVVQGFLDKYKDADSIKNGFVDFKDEFTNIKEVLVLRIESEESGVYSYWVLF
ncbi:MAG: hemerythrin domain-containing protein [Candidatus Komeilibacteria bacterium]|jgi:regulator of sigma D|nr:hemerythrin domain-containing protein [Candidatus Komeilibacteria bacterium]MBT4448055.1 hemerythrin domain-containing protein [Candidatus Komeilibacteria bacterium]